MRDFPCIIFLFLFFCFCCNAQDVPDSLIVSDTLTKEKANDDYKLCVKNLIIPGACVLYGVASLKFNFLKDFSTTTDEIKAQKSKNLILDNLPQYTPAIIVYGLNWTGVEGKHNFRDRTIIYLTSQILTASIVFPTKYIIKERRPDSEENTSFPSGHTATAFSSAQFMYLEYRDKNLWLSLSGYPFALFTGVYRVVNNHHWIGDVVAGAGIGIFSTEFSYWLFPRINKLLNKQKSNKQIMLIPSIQQENYGIAFVMSF